MKKLHVNSLENIDSLVHPDDFSESMMTSPALDLLSDFKFTQPAVIEAKTNAAKAIEIMRHEHEHLKLVIDDNEEMIGLIHFEHLSDQVLIKKIAAGEDRHEIKVRDLMTPRQKLKSFDFDQLHSATVGDVIHALQTSGEAHCLVVDKKSHQIRGVFSADDISRRLHTQLTIHKTPTVLNIFDVA